MKPSLEVVVATVRAADAIEEARIQAGITTYHCDTLMNRIQHGSIISRTVIEDGDGDVSYIRPVPKAFSLDPIRIDLTVREQLLCAWLRVRSSIALDEIQRRGNGGAYTTESTLEYSRQVDTFERRIAEIHANAATREQRARMSFYRQCVVGSAIVLLIALGFEWWGK